MAGPIRPRASQTNGEKAWGGFAAGSAGPYRAVSATSRSAAAAARSGDARTRCATVCGYGDATDTSHQVTAPVAAAVAKK